ncbi:GNAT family N-acetyltransferase [Curvibacter sp. APW13]|uniref:GNAT family N-acetyltransferase n=1 Tax=Curvibacter sp. APW13 TaxID=3077236 RepID=UPI0028E06F7C|nr:GNAT family N-acetyltransferase [Curvibacter sp. APW13]MDT8991985.1 GNAT family N-acetyltransferase [Curvibacter sp. APW13]
MPQPQGAWQVHRAQPEHAELLSPLCAAHATYERCDFVAQGHVQRLQAALASGRVHAWWLQQSGSEDAVGYASVTLDWATLAAQPFAHLDCLYLSAPVRGLGAGQLLVEEAIRFARAQGCSNLQWQTPHWNEGAIRFYHRLGARSQAKQRFALALQGSEACQWLREFR